MPILAADIEFYLSGGAANADVNASLGGAKSSVALTSAALHNLFDAVSSDESAAGDVEYRCIYIQNNHGTITWESVVAWIQTQTPSGDTAIALALAGEGVSGVAEVIADESTPPAGESFSAPAAEGSGLAVGNLAPGEFHAIWFRRTINAAAAAVASDNFVLRVKGDYIG